MSDSSKTQLERNSKTRREARIKQSGCNARRRLKFTRNTETETKSNGIERLRRDFMAIPPSLFLSSKFDETKDPRWSTMLEVLRGLSPKLGWSHMYVYDEQRRQSLVPTPLLTQVQRFYPRQLLAYTSENALRSLFYPINCLKLIDLWAGESTAPRADKIAAIHRALASTRSKTKKQLRHPKSVLG
jgi:hypothetical protein